VKGGDTDKSSRLLRLAWGGGGSRVVAGRSESGRKSSSGAGAMDAIDG